MITLGDYKALAPRKNGGVIQMRGKVTKRNADGSYEVDLNGSDVATTCSARCQAVVGDEVEVTVRNHTAVIMGRKEGA